MKTIKKITLMLTAIMVMAMTVGCGAKFDATNYVKAVLDNSYKNDSTGYVEQKIATAEEAEEIYNQGVGLEVSSVTAGAPATLTDDVMNSFTDTFKDLFKAADYNVVSSEKQSDGSYLVTVEYKQLQVFAKAYEAYNEKVQDIDASAYESEDELYNAVYQMLADEINTALASPEYGDTQTTTIRVALSGKVYTPDTKDLYNLEASLFDISAIN